jgi:hypothetical protein
LWGGGNMRKFDEEFFRADFFHDHRFKLGNLKFSDLLNENQGIKSWEESTTSSNKPLR